MAGVFYFPLVGTPTAAGNLLSFYEAGLDVALDVWTDSDLTIPWAQPIVLNADGESDGPIYVTPDVSQKVVYTDANGVAIAGYPVDFLAPSTITAAWSVLKTMVTVQFPPLTDAQIKALPTTAITLLEAPGAGFMSQPIIVNVFSKTTGGAYTNLNAAGFLQIAYTAQDDVISYVPNDAAITNGSATRLTDLLGTTTSKTVHLLPFMDTEHVDDWGLVAAVKTTANLENAALKISINNNGAGNLTGGNAANTLVVTMSYLSVSVP